MRINCHAHIFNITSVVTVTTLDILLRRITDLHIPDIIKDALASELEKLFKQAGNYVDEDALMRNVVQRISASSEVKDALQGLAAGNDLNLDLQGGAALQDYAVEKLVDLLGWIGSALGQGDKDAAKADILDALAFVRIALQPSIRHVTDELMDQLAPEDGTVALTVDITSNGENADQFERQLADTSAQVLAYPGRIFPFVAVNPLRTDHFSIMEHALNGRGFVGVKLYPSLGCKVDSEAMKAVIGYCESRKVPLLMHCSMGGFYYSQETRAYADPSCWDKILPDHPDLKICFGHFGGAENLVTGTITGWTAEILRLMEKFPGSVYSDISFHTEEMAGGDKEQNYFNNLSRLLKNDLYRDHILFGTDFFLVRSRLTEQHYWQYIAKHLSAAEFRQIAELNPAAFLGLPTGTSTAASNIQNYARYVYQQRGSLLAEAPDWLKGTITAIFGPTAVLPPPALGPKWSWNNKVHAYLYTFLTKEQLSTVQVKAGFDPVGRLKLRDLSYWNRGFEAPEIWKQKLSAMAMNLDTYLCANKAQYEQNQSSVKAVGTLEKLFDNGATYIHEAGEACDAIYRFV
jgi:predicted TIM-barrel fold metal-dependent hydrolase